ncbi:MAG TPA: aspartate-semialdehyde dehydrogenase [Chloroflexi bacterium]|nr:aspartate-semialdehyde dehydrogenase [Chloroflexota bacterium]
MKSYTVAVVGALGLVGSTMIRILEEYDFPVGQLKALEHRSLTGAPVAFKGQLIYTEEARPEAFDSIDIALFATGEEVSSVLAPEAARRGAVAIDNSRHFRLDPNVPLVTPEVNPEDLDWHKGIIANPNCTTVASILSYKVLHSLSPIRRIVASSYQSSSGGSLRGMMELRKQSLDMAAGYPISPPSAFRYPLAFNLIPFIDAFEGPEGYTREEWKMVHETRRMLHDDTIAITCTCIRVPTLVCHAVSLNVETAEHVSAERFREACAAQPGLKVVDDIENLEFPQPLKVAGGNEIHIGRIREDISCPNALNYYVVADNVRKGAAQNAVQIAQELIKRGLL